MTAGDFCYTIAGEYGISLETLYANNLNINNPKCDNLPTGGVSDRTNYVVLCLIRLFRLSALALICITMTSNAQLE